MSDIIQLLPDHVANQIAAGEVVQRPASVVKELLENAIDAGAKSIQLIVKDSGKTLIHVIDDGKGMSVTDARLCFERHATSKISRAEDLFNLNTKGFRGEALASIAAIAHVELKTKQENQEVGTAIRIEGSKVVSQEVIVTPKGTSLAVKNLFFNIPARRNFLKSNQVELRHITDEFNRVALAHPDIAFNFHHNGSQLFNLPISNIKQRIVNIFGAKTKEKLVPVDEDTDILNISGFVLKPEFAKKSRGEQFFFVNNRFIKNSYLHHAVVSAFEGLLKEKTYPSYFLFLEVAPETIDINIHPTKTEIKFDNEHDLYAMLRATVKHSLGMFNVAPVLDFEKDQTLDTPYSFKDKEASLPKIEVDSSFNPFQQEERTFKSSAGGSFKSQKTKSADSWESLYVGLKDEVGSSIQIESSEQQEVASAMFSDVNEEEHVQHTFQLQNKFIITTIKSGLLAIHQQRAHERVLFETYLKQITGDEGMSQQLLFPLQLDFSPSDLGILLELKEQLFKTGFDFKVMDQQIELSGLPIILKESQIQETLESLINEVKSGLPEDTFSQNTMIAQLLAEKSAVKTGTSLSTEEQLQLVNQLFACKETQLSPTNKPIFTTFTTLDIDKKLS